MFYGTQLAGLEEGYCTGLERLVGAGPPALGYCMYYVSPCGRRARGLWPSAEHDGGLVLCMQLVLPIGQLSCIMRWRHS
nr:hypothetical protein CFP56_03717 [Quercus suber]